jgi:hypothetical protein
MKWTEAWDVVDDDGERDGEDERDERMGRRGGRMGIGGKGR